VELPLLPALLSAARAAVLAAPPSTEVIIVDSSAGAICAGLNSFPAKAVVGVFANQALSLIFRRLARGGSGSWRDVLDDAGNSPTSIPANAWTDVSTTWPAANHRLVLKTGATPPTTSTSPSHSRTTRASHRRSFRRSPQGSSI
jgi:hypothetical protein